jgi:hypothetical protein
MLFFLSVAALTFGIISVRARLMGTNGGVVPRGRPAFILSTLAAFLTITIAVWCFLTFAWAWPLVAFLMANFVIIGLVAWGAWPALCRAVPAIDAVVVVLDLALWIGSWPFR